MSRLRDSVSRYVGDFMEGRNNGNDIRSLLLTRNGSRDKLPGRQISTPNGIAISPQCASHCLSDHSRSRAFLLGLRRAVAEILKRKTSVHILEAGGGPHPLSLLLAAHSEKPIRVSSVDINPGSVAYSTSLARDLGVEFSGIQAELTQEFECEQPDIILAEVMDAGLQKEPQGAVTWALARKFGLDPIFLPDEIILTALLNRSPFGTSTIALGEFVRVDRGFRKQALNGRLNPMLNVERTFNVPDGWESAHLRVETFVRVYGDHVINPGSSVITSILDMHSLTPNGVTGAVKVSTRMGGFGFTMRNCA